MNPKEAIQQIPRGSLDNVLLAAAKRVPSLKSESKLYAPRRNQSQFNKHPEQEIDRLAIESPVPPCLMELPTQQGLECKPLPDNLCYHTPPPSLELETPATQGCLHVPLPLQGTMNIMISTSPTSCAEVTMTIQHAAHTRTP